jgi:type I restriction enzyme R subunit
MARTIGVTIRETYHREGICPCGGALTAQDAVIAEGIQILVKQVSLFTPEFDEKLRALKSDDARASEMEHAIKSQIHARIEDNPAFFTSLRERLERIVEDGKAKRIDAAQQLELFQALARELRGEAGAAEELGLSETGFAIYGLLTERPPLVVSERTAPPYGTPIDEARTALASLLEEQLEPQVAIVDWAHKEDVQREMRRLIKRQLRAASLPAEKVEATAESIVDLLKRRRGR